MEDKYLVECRIEAVAVNGDVVSINCLSIDWLKRRDVIPSRSEYAPQLAL